MSKTDATVPQEMLRVGGHKINPRVLDSIRAASKATGVDFKYLMAQAQRESSFQAEAGSSVSSAAGLYQFTKTTWLEMVHKHGAKHGLSDLAAKIERRGGEYAVSDAATRKEILELRRDPEIAALMAGEYANDNKEKLERVLDRPATTADLYLAHFLGPAGAARMLKAQSEDSSQPAAALVPAAARHNPDVFFENGQTPSSVAAVYGRIKGSIERPMRQYAGLEHMPASTAPTPLVPVAVAAAAKPVEVPYALPDFRPDAIAAAEATTPVEVAALADVRSADQISLPMPARPSASGTPTYSTPGAWPTSEPKGLDRLLGTVKRSLFG